MSQYETYQAVDFAQDESFMSWVNEGRPVPSFWTEWLEAHPEKQIAVDEAIQLVESLQFRTIDVSSEKVEAIWNAIDERTHGEAKVRSMTQTRRIFLYAAAAIAALLIGFFMFQPKLNTIETLYAEKTQHQLPDGTIVYLNVDSEIAYDEKKWAKKRKISLSGEAFFEVRKGSTFEVETDYGSVFVLGTSFNVRTRESLEVVCFTGKVEVITKNEKSVKLLPGDGVKYVENADDLEMIQVAPETHRYWRKGSMLFRATPLREVFSEIERQFDVTIECSEEMAQRAFDGEVSLNNLLLGLSDISEPMNLKYERNQGVYQFSDK